MTKVQVIINHTEPNTDGRYQTVETYDVDNVYGGLRNLIGYCQEAATALDELGQLASVELKVAKNGEPLFRTLVEPKWWDLEMYQQQYSDYDFDEFPVYKSTRAIIEDEPSFVQEFKSRYLDFVMDAYSPAKA